MRVIHLLEERAGIRGPGDALVPSVAQNSSCFILESLPHSDQPITLLHPVYCASRRPLTPDLPQRNRQAGMSKKKRQAAARGERSFDHSKWRRRTVAVQLMYEGQNFAGFCSQVLCCSPFCRHPVVPKAFRPRYRGRDQSSRAPRRLSLHIHSTLLTCSRFQRRGMLDTVFREESVFCAGAGGIFPDIYGGFSLWKSFRNTLIRTIAPV